ncbi:efflux ABC transporter, permease protein [Bifidobacterium lemurum]|uniref:Efflux ABC transporter, permease protein n=1 Tax=Bifidobacterium lemurum TaxID=1603886 RepID=A0A261FUQ1_9BIFI|nr:ABC transporter permease [Bifidobacterium lemurum]OZG62838.1 efflux ABC transporter, permease protein [Bifidobacterium lemurum]QOL35168.1 FtsX-like permease family protein [Bifidobacterium lemurum]
MPGGAFVKGTARAWLRGWKRFLSIAVISMLGVAVLTGIYAGCRDMFHAADRLYDAQGLHDIQVLSTYGLTDDDVAALKRVEGVETVQAERTQSVTTKVAGTDKNVTMTEIGVEGLDQPYLQEGRMPEKAGEVAVTEKFLVDSGYEIGDTLTVTPADDEESTAGTSGSDLTGSDDFGASDDATDAADGGDSTGASDSAGEPVSSDADTEAGTDADADNDGDEEEETAPSFPTKLTITGMVLDPKDLTNPTGYSTAAFRSPSTADYYFFTSSDGVSGNVYTAISLTVEGAADEDSFSDAYEEIVRQVVDRIENTVQDQRQKDRRQRIVDEAQSQIDEAEQDAFAQLDDAQSQIDEQRAQLEESKSTLAESREQLESQQSQITSSESQIAQARSQIASGRQQISQGRQQIAQARTELESGQQQLASARAQLDAAQQTLTSNLTQVNQGIAQIDQMLPLAEQALAVLDQLPEVGIDQAAWERIASILNALGIPVDPTTPPTAGIADLKQQLAQSVEQMQTQRAQLVESLDQLNAGQAQLDEQNAQLTAKENEAAAGSAELNQQSANLEAQAAQLEAQATQLESQAAQLASGKQQLEEGLKQLEDGEEQLADGETQLADAQSELDDQRQQVEDEFAKQQQTIDDIASARWYVQTRSSIGGFSALESDISSIQSIGYAFPIVFLLVAVLMSLTTMTRMVEEERSLAGTFTALGYGSRVIALRYLLFATLACLVGGALGLLLGFLGIPSFLLLVLEDMYVIPGIALEYDWLYGSAGIALFLVGVLVATAVACAGELKHTPAELMRPKAPKAGARVLLERITPLWRRLSFLNKVTVRNLFRFKSRLIMTVGGVAGCTALIVCGLAINDTVDTLGPKQYEDIYQYDLMVVASDDSADELLARVAADSQVGETLDLRVESGELQSDSGSESIQLMVVPDGDEDVLGEMITLRDAADTRETLALDDSGVIVSQSAANAFDIQAGDRVSLVDGDMRHGTATVAAVSRNLIGSDVYISEDAYRQVFDVQAPLTLNAMLATLDGTADEKIAYADELKTDAAVLSAVSCDDMERSFTFDLMGAVVALIVALAGSLALVVLFTLANTNVSERVREMATLKVLGFYDREVHTYVNKEMMILTLGGIAVGLPLGRVIGGMLTAVLNMPSIYFEVSVHWWSYAIAAVATLVFALAVQLLTNPVLDRIDPVSSLKSVE